MRVLLFALMIALLPLRGWVGDAFAMQMTPAHCATMKNIAASPDSTGARCHLDAHSEHASTPCADPIGSAERQNPDDSSAPEAATQGHCASGSACLVLQITAAITSTQVQAPAAPRHLRWQAQGETFASISLAPSLKPPIS